MDSKNNNDTAGQNGQELPGYPHYPAAEDIAQPGNNNGIISIDGEAPAEDTSMPNEDITMGTEADVTEEDLELLSAIDDGRSRNSVRDILDDTDEDGEPLNERNTASGLDVPGSELDDENEQIGEEDEENNYYSLGSDANDSLEQGT
ncbi:MAG: hypothetical protein JNL72_07575 [Flavipsychrobacter sp.]|nr:hypothetical protein [Flavipsychrobacter sp.]